MFFLFVFALLPILIITGLIIQRSALIQKKMDKLEQKRKELEALNSVLEIEKTDLQRQRDELQQALERSLMSIETKDAQLEVWQERQKEFHSIKFTRISGWGSPAYSISVDALGNVLYEGQAGVRKKGFFQWKIYRKRIQNLNHIIQKAHFFEINPTIYRSKIDEISQVEIEIYLKNGKFRTVKYDHASHYPIELGFLEQKLDVVLGTKKLWLYWGQKVIRLTMTKGLNYKVSYLRNQGLFYSILGKEYYSSLYNQAWTPIDKLLQKYETAWKEETYLSNRNLPKNTIWIELETGFRLLIDQQVHPTIYADFLQVINDYGAYLKENVGE